MQSVPPLKLTLTIPKLRDDRTSIYATPRGAPKYSPRTHREELEDTGKQLTAWLEVAADIAEEVVQLSARAQRSRAALIAENIDGNARGEQCAVCLEGLRDPVACSNNHRFCSECVRSCRLHSPRLLCPLCRVAMPGDRGQALTQLQELQELQQLLEVAPAAPPGP